MSDVNSRSTKRKMDIAIKVALTGEDSRQFRHGSVLISRGGSVISFAANNQKFSSFVDRFYHRSTGSATRHSECNCVLNIPPEMTKGASIFVARVNRQGEIRMSKPCELCQSVLRFCGVKWAYYTENDGSISRMRI